MVPERDLDPAALYEQERLAFIAYLQHLSPAALETTVAATPAWSVRDVLSHVVGITADLNAQRFGDGDGDAWTAAQVEERRRRSLSELALEWDREAPLFETGLRLMGYEFGAHYLGDLLQHVGDTQSALGDPPARDDDALAVALDFYLRSFEATVDELGAGAVAVQSGGEGWTLGRGPTIAAVSAPRYELFRALGGRRTLEEIRSLPWTGDVDAIAGCLSRYPVPAQSLAEARA